MSASQRRVLVVGVGADGWRGLGGDLRSRVEAADVVLGGARHLEMLPAVTGQVRVAWPSPLRAQLPCLLEEYADQSLVVIASGDPLVSGIGSTLVELLGAEQVEVVPTVSSVTLARARMGWSAESCAVVSAVGRDPHAVLRELAPDRRVLVLSSDRSTPKRLAELLTEAGYGASEVTVLGNLGSRLESRESHTAKGFDLDCPQLNIVAVELRGRSRGGWSAGLPDELFEHDGQLTKRDVRASALARLAPCPGELLWDVGAGAGSVGIEWMRAHPSLRTIAIEGDPTRAARITRNAQALGVPALEVVTGRAPDALAGLAEPDAVFIGGGATIAGVVERCTDELRAGGRLVAHGVTLETEQTLAHWYGDLGGELTRLHVEQAAPIGRFTGWSPARTVTQWTWRKP